MDDSPTMWSIVPTKGICQLPYGLTFNYTFVKANKLPFLAVVTFPGTYHSGQGVLNHILQSLFTSPPSCFLHQKHFSCVGNLGGISGLGLVYSDLGICIRVSGRQEKTMGRGKIEIKKIENSTNRQVTFSKRRGGLIKKAQELSILCSAEVAVIIFSNTGKLCEFSSSSMNKILGKYQKEKGSQLWDVEHQNLYNEIKRLKEENERFKGNLRHMKGEDVNSLPLEDLYLLEQALEIAIERVRTKKDHIFIQEIYSSKKRLSSLEEENKRLREISGNCRPMAMERENGYNVYGGGEGVGSLHISPTFRVQPSHPNLKDTGY